MIEMIAPIYEPGNDGDGVKLVHVKTIYKTFTKSDLSDSSKIEEVTGTLANKKLNLHLSNVIVPVGKTYYVTLTYIVSPVNSDTEAVAFVTKPVAVISEDTISTRMLAPVTIVQEPQILVKDLDKFYTHFYLPVPIVRQGTGVLKSTHWYIESENGSRIFHSLYDSINKLSLSIESSKLPKGKFKVYASYVMTDHVESSFNSLVVTKT